MVTQKVIGLVRVSSEEQAEEGRGGIERQWRDISAICAREGLEIVERYQLEDVSGSAVKHNSQFQKMLRHVAGSGIAGLVVSSPDRLMRCDSLADLAVLQPFGDDTKLRLIWTSDATYSLTKFDSQIMFLMRTLIGGHEKKQISKRTQDGKTIAREQGNRRVDSLPVGVEFTVTDKSKKTGVYSYAAAAEPMRKAFMRMLDRNTSVKALAAELGFKAYQTLRKQLVNPVWIGLRETREKCEKLPFAAGDNGKVRYKRVRRAVPIRVKMALAGEPLISEEVFNEVQEILGKTTREHHQKRAGKSKFELSGLLRCPCGAKYYSKSDDRNGKSGFYVCKSGYFDTSKKCGYPNLNRKEIDDAVTALLASKIGNPKRLVSMLEAATVPKDASDLRDERSRLQHQADLLTGKRTKLIDRIADGILTEDEAKVSMAKIRSDIERTKNQLNEIDRKLTAVKIADVDSVVKSVISLLKGLKFMPAERRKAVVRSLVQEIQLGQDKQVQAMRLRLGAGQSIELNNLAA
jgi:DNA invertase Pin-like site-specific DNA recombinase